MRLLLLVIIAVVLAGCSSAPPRTEQAGQPVPVPAPEKKAPPSKGGYYKDDGPDEKPPPNLASIPDAVPRDEPLHRYANRPYTVFGKGYVPIASRGPHRERGTASWYGKKFHGQKTSSGEIYDMYKMSAAHKTLPIPSYARVTNVANGKSVVVRINDRGPFHSDRIIDLSYAAAYKLGYIAAGSALVEVESVSPDQASAAPPPAALAAVPAAAPPAATLAALPAAASATPPPATGSVVEAKGTFIQVGAFSSRENAEDFRGRVARQLAWLSEGIQVLSIGNLWRLHVGPYENVDAARSSAERIETELNLRPLFVVR